MKKYTLIITCVVALGLVGCATQQAQSQFKKRFAVENAAWAEAVSTMPERCFPNKTEVEINEAPKPNETIAATKCLTVLIQEKVIPVAVYSDLVLKMRADALRNAEAYANGKISAEEWEARGTENWANYTEQTNERVNRVLMQTAQQDAITRQKMEQGFNQGFYGYQQQVQRQQAIRPVTFQQQPMMRNTFSAKCKSSPILGGIVQCTTW